MLIDQFYSYTELQHFLFQEYAVETQREKNLEAQYFILVSRFKFYEFNKRQI